MLAISLFSRSSKEAHSYLQPLMFLAILPVLLDSIGIHGMDHHEEPANPRGSNANAAIMFMSGSATNPPAGCGAGSLA